MTVVYWDRVVVLNGIVDYLLLLSAAWLSGLPLRRGRLVLWAALGGLYAGAVFLPGLEVLGVPVIRAAAGIVMALGAMKWRWRPAGVFLLLAAGLIVGGISCILSRALFAALPKQAGRQHRGSPFQK